MSVSSSQMDASTHAKTSNILNGALYSVENVKVHQVCATMFINQPLQLALCNRIFAEKS